MGLDLDVISEEFVNYNRLSGRGRDYLESMGLLWFMNYKIRIMKIMGKMVRDRPATALLYAGGVGPWMDVDTVVPGHGPVTDKSGVSEVRDYLAYVDREASARHAAGMDAFDAARDLADAIGAVEQFSSLGEFGRIAVNVEAVYRELDPEHRSPDVVEQFRRMAELEA